ncbi:MAG: DUF4956 domain-containing protein [Bacilli bacterium]|nr:DUF4956 domain-containing protein [Clostridium sp.]MDY3797688.1 DUF4956 domain-containing protein [Bacilli bacterium]CDE95444.1 putative uncharacterized protein [Clostridium sp. CAG:914]
MKKVLQALAEMQVKMPIQTVLLVLLVAFLVSLIIYLTYKNTYTGVLYNPRFNVSLIMITMVTTMVMVVIGSNISVSLGMVGALSIIRFRTAVKDPRDTAFIFWCVVSGLACGTQNYTIVIVGSVFICLILFLFKKFTTKNNKYVLIIKGKSFDLKEVEKTLDKKLKDYICKGKYISVNGMETIYDVKIKDSKISDDIIVSLSKVSGVNTINIVSSNTDTMG